MAEYQESKAVVLVGHFIFLTYPMALMIMEKGENPERVVAVE
jgi:hypothetical protein